MKLPEIQDRLIAHVAMADRSAFEAIYDQAAGLLYAICLRILQDAQEAEDCVQSLFTQLWNCPEDLRAASEPLMMQLVTAARAEAMLRRVGQDRNIEPIATRDLSPLQPNARPSTVEAQDGSLSGVLDQMPPARSTLMRRIILDGEGYADLSRASQVDVGTVRTSIAQTLASLAAKLGAPEFSREDIIAAGEAALGLRDRGSSAPELSAFWNTQIATMIGAEVQSVAPSSQLKRRLDAALFAEKRETLWQQVWPYAAGGVAAAFLLWVVVASGLLVPI